MIIAFIIILLISFLVIITITIINHRLCLIQRKLKFKIVKHPINKLEKTDKIIWSYWHDNNIPLLVKLALHTWYKWNPDYLICFIIGDDISYYVDTDTFPKNYKNSSHQHKADIIRIALLEKYGGIWMDSTIFLNKPLSNTWDPKNYDIGGYYADFFTTNINKPVFENWFISAPKNSILIKNWKNEFFKAVDSPSKNDFIKELEKTVDLQNIDSKEYLLMHCCFLKVINDHNYNLKIFKATDGPFFYLKKNNFDFLNSTFLQSLQSVWYLIKSTDEKNVTIIKLTGRERYILLYILPFYSTKSILYKLI